VADEIRRAFNLSRAAQKVLILDCCYAGAMGPNKMKGSASDSLSAIAEGSSGTFILTASTKFQPAFERKELGGSVLTSCLVDGIAKGEAAPDSDTVTLSALASYAKAQAPTHGAQQPQFWDFGSKGEVVFARRPTTFDEPWRLRVSQVLAQHHVDGHIEYDMHEEMRAAIVAPTDETTRPAKELIDRLLKKKIGLARFGSAWTDLREAQAKPPPQPPEPEAAPRPEAVAPQAFFAQPPAPPLPEPALAPSTVEPRLGSLRTSPVKPTFWRVLKGDEIGPGAKRYHAPLLMMATAAALLGGATVGGGGAVPGFTSIVLACLGVLWGQLRMVSAPGAGGGRRMAAALISAVVALFAGWIAVLLWNDGGEKAWAPLFAVPAVLALWLTARLFGPAGDRAGRRPTPS
jgi:hypothetical protein